MTEGYTRLHVRGAQASLPPAPDSSRRRRDDERSQCRVVENCPAPAEAVAVIDRAALERGITPGTDTPGTDNGSAYTSRSLTENTNGVHARAPLGGTAREPD